MRHRWHLSAIDGESMPRDPHTRLTRQKLAEALTETAFRQSLPPWQPRRLGRRAAVRALGKEADIYVGNVASVGQVPPERAPHKLV